MPEGVVVVVEYGEATIDFVDPKKKGPALHALNLAGDPSNIETLTREKGAERVRYRVMEDHARAAGLLDEVSQVDALDSLDTSSATDVSGLIPPVDPSITNLHAQDVRTGSLRAEGAVVGDFEPVFIPQDAVLPATDPVEFDNGGQLPGGVLAINTSGSEDTIAPPAGTQPEAPETPAAPEQAGDSTPRAPQDPPAADAGQPERTEDAPKPYPAGEPAVEWKRPELNAYAFDKFAIDTTDTEAFPRKADVFTVITEAAKKAAEQQ